MRSANLTPSGGYVPLILSNSYHLFQDIMRMSIISTVVCEGISKRNLPRPAFSGTSARCNKEKIGRPLPTQRSRGATTGNAGGLRCSVSLATDTAGHETAVYIEYVARYVGGVIAGKKNSRAGNLGGSAVAVKQRARDPG